jgi:3-oxoadipate enol-lactonase
MNWIEVNGASLRYELSGAGAHTVVLLHELGGGLESWDPIVPGLHSSFRTLRYDQRGSGLSEKLRGSFALDAAIEDLVALLDGLNVTAPCHVIGSAIGAAMGIALAARYPQRVDRLIAANPATGVTAEQRVQLRERALAVERGGMRTAVERSLDNSYPAIVRKDRARFEAYRLRWLTNDPASYAALNRMLETIDLSKEFGRVRCPTLVCTGIHDTLCTPAMVKPIAAAIPGARYLELDTAHFMGLQTPELFLQHALPFLHGG